VLPVTARNGERTTGETDLPSSKNWRTKEMLIGERLKQIRIEKGLSQGDIEDRTKLLRCYTSRCENGHTVPSVGTLEKYAQALGVPLYKLFTDDENVKVKNGTKSVSAISNKDKQFVHNLERHVKVMEPRDRKLLMVFATALARRAA
jgi:transcriptional regulator with XRE-family HTH domain